MLGDECRQAQAFIQLAHQKQTGVGGDARPRERDLQETVKRELNGSCRYSNQGCVEVDGRGGRVFGGT